MDSKWGSFLLIAIIVIVLVSCGKGCGGSSSSSHSSYSDQYNYDSRYRSNVDSAADTWGVSSQEMDRKLQNLGRAMH